jgi:hypothetical protein
MVSVLVLTIFVLLILHKHIKVNNKVLDFLFVCTIIIVGRNYLKIAVFLTFLLFLIKTNTCSNNEGFQTEVDNLDKENEDEDEDDDDDDEEKDKSEESSYTTDCMVRCKENKYSEKECERICKGICPNPMKYEENLKELDKFKKIIQKLNNEK